MRKILYILIVLLFAIILLLSGHNVAAKPKIEEPVKVQQDPTEKVVAYLNKKSSPLSDKEVNLLVKQKHWKLLIAISAIESQYCKRQKYFNCWGIGGDHAYRKYKNFSEAIVDANDLIERWQKKEKWLTVESMNCSYVVPCNPNWVNVVNFVLKQLNEI